jgi:hypothetical protein
VRRRTAATAAAISTLVFATFFVALWGGHAEVAPVPCPPGEVTFPPGWAGARTVTGCYDPGHPPNWAEGMDETPPASPTDAGGASPSPFAGGWAMADVVTELGRKQPEGSATWDLIGTPLRDPLLQSDLIPTTATTPTPTAEPRAVNASVDGVVRFPPTPAGESSCKATIGLSFVLGAGPTGASLQAHCSPPHADFMPVDASGSFDGVSSFTIKDSGDSSVTWTGTLEGGRVTITGGTFGQTFAFAIPGAPVPSAGRSADASVEPGQTVFFSWRNPDSGLVPGAVLDLRPHLELEAGSDVAEAGDVLARLLVRQLLTNTEPLTLASLTDPFGSASFTPVALLAKDGTVKAGHPVTVLGHAPTDPLYLALVVQFEHGGGVVDYAYVFEWVPADR